MKKKKYFALATQPNGPVYLLCEDLKAGKFFAVNGAWEGFFDGKEATVTATNHRFFAYKIWSGYWPSNCIGYEEAIEKIEERINREHAEGVASSGNKTVTDT